MTGDGSEDQFCREQRCIGTWNVRSMNQGKLDVAKQEMTRVLIQMTIIPTTVGKNPLEEVRQPS